MSTPFSDLYAKFTVLVTDSSLSALTESDLEDVLETYLSKSSYLDFKACQTDLETLTSGSDGFDADLTKEEQWIIVYGMVITWLEAQIQRDIKLKTAISDRDFKLTSNANQLKENKELLIYYRQIQKNLIDSYVADYFDDVY